MNLSKLLWIIVGILAGALVGFLGYSLVVKKDTVARVTSEVSEQEIKNEAENNSEGVKPAVQQTATEYKNTEFGFSLQLPASWKGYTSAVYKVETDGYFTVGVTHPTEKIYPPADFPTTSKPIPKTYSFIVVPIATWNKWYVTGEGAQPFAAGVGASEFGRNSQYVFAMAPRYYYGAYVYGENVSEKDKKEGEQIAQSFKVFNPIPKVTAPSVQKPKPTVTASVGIDTFSQFENITSWTVTEDFVVWKNYYALSQNINDRLKKYSDGQMVALSKTFNPNSIEQKNTIDAVFASLTQNNWKRIADSYATDFVRFDQYLYEKNSKPLILTIEKTQFEKEQMIVQIQFLK